MNRGAEIWRVERSLKQMKELSMHDGENDSWVKMWQHVVFVFIYLFM